MKLRIHFAVGQTAMEKVVQVTDDITLEQFANNLSKSRKVDATATFTDPDDYRNNFTLAARSIVLVEEL